MARERPILFASSMVRAILSGAKTQTRRPVKPQPDGQPALCSDGKWCVDGGLWLGSAPAAVGDTLWARETWRRQTEWEEVYYPNGGIDVQPVTKAHYRADATDGDAAGHVWTPSIHMPRWASRITLEVTDVRAERLLDVTEADAVAEGLTVLDAIRRKVPTVRDAFSLLWDDLYADSLPWSGSPWVWAITFRRVTP